MRVVQHGLVTMFGLLTSLAATSAEWTVPMRWANTAGSGEAIGSVVLTDSAHGLEVRPALNGLAPGVHGFHVHEHGSCAPGVRDGVPVAALGAGGHLDPAKTGRHGLPWGNGHLGDLPGLVVVADGSASVPVLAPRLKTSDVAGLALVIHAGGDNHADQPQPLGGGGARVACGLIPR